MSKHAIIGKQYKVLDHGFIRVVDAYGDDSRIVDAARVSYQDGTKTINDDKGLINYLMRHWHSTPFEMADITLHVKLPIFVARQWMRHRTGSFNEVSARYSIVKDEFYTPEASRIKTQCNKNKQKSSDKLLSELDAKSFIDGLVHRCNNTIHAYNSWLSVKGVAREIARIILPQNMYTEFYWKVNAHNLMHFLKLRSHETAQEEIRAYADVIIDEILQQWIPLTYDAFRAYRLESMQLTAYDIDSIKAGKIMYFPTQREEKEFLEKIALLNVTLTEN